MASTRWVPVGPAEDVVGPPWPRREVDGHPVRLVRDEVERIHAVADGCPHLGSPLTHAEVTGDRLACPHHWYEFSLADGSNVFPGYDLPMRVYETRVVAGIVEVAAAHNHP